MTQQPESPQKTHRTIHSIFKKGSKTYFYNSLFFPRDVKNDVFVLYSFVRKADNYVDRLPIREGALVEFRGYYERSLAGHRANDVVIDSFVDLMHRRHFQPAWVEAFLDSMAMDLSKKRYETIEETEKYIYGSAEVIGLMMASIFRVDPRHFPEAKALGKAMQFINFLRDIAEDLTLGRIYFPQDELHSFGLDTLEYEHVMDRPDEFRDFIRHQIRRYAIWQRQGEEGFPALPRRYRIPVMAASDMYNWTARRIARNPFIVYQRKVKPSLARIVVNVMGRKITLGSSRARSRPRPALFLP